MGAENNDPGDRHEPPPKTPARMGSTRVQISVVVVGVFLAFIALLAYSLTTREAVTGASGSERPGKAAPEFSLAALIGGETINLSDYSGQPVVVNFWASWCAPCRVEMPHFIDAFEKNREEVTFIGIDVQDSRRDAEEFISTFQVPVDRGYLILVDPSAVATIDYGVSGLPATFFIDRDGIVVKRWVGAINDTALAENIALIAQG